MRHVFQVNRLWLQSRGLIAMRRRSVLWLAALSLRRLRVGVGTLIPERSGGVSRVDSWFFPSRI